MNQEAEQERRRGVKEKMNLSQKTIGKKATFKGKALHSGRLVLTEVYPAAPHTGIVFHRNDSVHARPVPACARFITSTDLSTTIGQGASSVATVEHLMAAFAGLGIDNAVVRLNGPELPILDGSAAPFVKGLLEAGLDEQKVPRRMIKVRKPVELRHGDQYIRLTPAPESRIQCSIDFAGKVIGYQSIRINSSLEDFLGVSQARTFCHINDVHAMRQQGLALGGSLENAVVVSDSGILNEEGLRTEDEFVRHKLLDLIGDLYLLGGPLLGQITVHKPGHTLHSELMFRLLNEDRSAISILNDRERSSAPYQDALGPVAASSAFG